jgi:RnfABCDGE-type electron transport complex B subunit
MNSILVAIGALAVLGMAMSIILGLAAKVFYVYVDPRIENILDALPGANCGGCGYAGCSDYAEAIVKHGESPNLCVAGSSDVTENVCTIMGLSASLGERKVARIFCQGDDQRGMRRFNYVGARDCRAAIVATGGDKACQYGCVGLGSCVRSCPFGAMGMGENGLPVVYENLCTGCGNCADICPRNIPRLVPARQKVLNLCSSLDAGKTVKQVCSVGCIACGQCVKKCPEGAVTMQDRLAVVDPDKCTMQQVCVEKCPTGSMVNLERRTEQVALEQSEEERESASQDAAA